MFEDLRPYQIADAKFLAARHSAALFNEQRTGKTPTVLYALALQGTTRNLIICPASAQHQWQSEYMRWLGKPCQICIGTLGKRQQILRRWTHGLIISYEMLREHANKLDDDHELGYILSHLPDAVVLDEAHRIRDPSTKTAKAVFKLSKVTTKYVLTGTPTMNHTHEIWSILHFLYPRTFHAYWTFIEEYFNTYKQTNKQGRRYVEINAINNKGILILEKVLPHLSTSRKRKEIMQWLPDKEYVPIILPPSREQLKYLDDLATMWETEDIVTIGVLDRLIRYRQICLDPGILDLKGGSPKTEWLLSYLKDYPERPTLVFSKFTQYLLRLAKQIHPAPALIIGPTAVKNRQKACLDFQTGKTNLLLLNIDAGKEALTLDRAQATIFMDKYPPVGDLQQAEDRFVSTTIDKADKEHLIYSLCLQGTYDEDINTMIAARKSETDIINNFKQHLERRQRNAYRSKVPQSPA